MSETLWGVIVGGVIASISPVCTILFERNRWLKEKRIEHLRMKRTQAEANFKVAVDEVCKSILEKSYPMDLLGDMRHIFPKAVSEKFDLLIKERNMGTDKVKFHLFEMNIEMKKYLSEMDLRIESELGLKN